MNERRHARFEFPSTPPLSGIEPGTNVLVSGPSGRGAREVALRLVTDAYRTDEAALLVSADVDGRALLERVEEHSPRVDRSRLAVLDCSGTGADDQERFGSPAVDIEGPAALPEIGVELSRLYEALVAGDAERVRIGTFSVSALLAHAGHRPVSRFVHMLTGRVIATGDLGVFVVDESTVDDRSVEAIRRFCDGEIAVRDDDGFEVRVEGVDDARDAWQPVDAVDAE